MKNRKKLKNKIITMLIVALFLHIIMPLSTLAQNEATSSNIEEVLEEIEDVEESFEYNEEQEELEEETVSCIEESESNIEEDSLEIEEATISNANENFEKNENKEDDFVIENVESEEEITFYIEATMSNTDEILIETKEATMSNANKATSSEIEKIFSNSPTEPDILTGMWSVDGITSYYFNVDGNGAMILPKHRYFFKYIIEENKLILNFEDNRIKEVTFNAFIENDELILEKTEEDKTIKFILKK